GPVKKGDPFASNSPRKELRPSLSKPILIGKESEIHTNVLRPGIRVICSAMFWSAFVVVMTLLIFAKSENLCAARFVNASSDSSLATSSEKTGLNSADVAASTEGAVQYLSTACNSEGMSLVKSCKT